jgi:uncharacterized membrane protein YgdD (TMEM256/DUF423 family)
MLSPRLCGAWGAWLAALAVGVGAFGAHWLRQQVPAWYPQPEVADRMLETWEVGVRYQMYSAVGLILAGLWGSQEAGRRVRLVSMLFLLGTAIFSGGLYLLVLTGQRFLGAVVPVGGIFMIAAWSLFAWQAMRERSERVGGKNGS